MNFQAYPLLFEPVYKNTIWGGDKLSSYIGVKVPKNSPPVAELWSICDRQEGCSVVANGEYVGMTLRELIEKWPQLLVGQRHRKDQLFPLMVKIIDAGERLSLQVHPDEMYCRKHPENESKTELFYILDHDENSQIFAGMGHNKTQSQFRSLVDSSEIENCIQSFSSRQGDAYYIPAGTVHSIGAGNLILEIQQNSNTTFRVTDWGRLDKNGESRRLDVEEALNAIKFNDRSLPLVRADERTVIANKKRELVRPNKYIKVEELKIVGDFFSNTSSKGFHLLSAIDCDFTVKCQAGNFIIKKGQTCLLPAKLGSYGICPEPGETYTIMRSQVGL